MMNVVQTSFLYDPWAVSIIYHRTGKSATVLIINIDTDEEEAINVRNAKEFC